MFNMANRRQIPAYRHWAASAHLPMGNFTQLDVEGQKEEGWESEREIQSEKHFQIP